MEAPLLLALFCSLGPLLFVLLFHLWKHHPSYGANPGLPTFPLVGGLPLILLNKHRLYLWSSETLNSTPSLTVRVVIGLSSGVSTANPANVQHILKTRFESYPKGPSFYAYFSDLLGSGIFNSDGGVWRMQRKVASHEFTSSSMKDFVMDVAEAEICNRLMPALHAASDTGRPVDLQALLLQYTFDTICQLTFGADPTCLGSSENTPDVDDLVKGFPKAFEVALRITADRFITPAFIWKIKRALRIGDEKELRDALAVVNRFASSVIQGRKKEFTLGEGAERKDLLSRFMRLTGAKVEELRNEHHEGAWVAAQGQKMETLSDSFLTDILLSFLMAGREPVASGVAFLMWLLSCHPCSEKAVRAEVGAVLKARGSNQDSEPTFAKVRTFSYDELKQMNYLHAALSESMRLYPPVPSDCKYAAEDDILPDGTVVRKGNQVAYNIFAMGRSEKIWGTDCCEFKPERWLAEDGQFVPESPFKYPVFQAGPRVCLGKDFAFIQMKLLVASLVREFEFEPSRDFKPQLSYGVSMMMVNGFPVTVKPREESSRG